MKNKKLFKNLFIREKEDEDEIKKNIENKLDGADSEKKIK